MYFFHPYRFRIDPDGTGLYGAGTVGSRSIGISDRRNTDVQTIDVTKLRKILKENPYLDGSTPEILVDDSDIDKIERSGHWQKALERIIRTAS